MFKRKKRAPEWNGETCDKCDKPATQVYGCAADDGMMRTWNLCAEHDFTGRQWAVLSDVVMGERETRGGVS
jgi:hypothetical protein